MYDVAPVSLFSRVLLSHVVLLQPPAVLARIRRWAIFSAVVYTVGVPLGFAWVLFRYRVQIREDQLLLSRGIGNSPESNPQYHVRRKFNQLYQ